MSQQIGPITEISMDGFQVVSGDMFSQSTRSGMGTCTLWKSCISFSKAAIMTLNCCERILIRVNPNDKCILLTPALSSDKDSIVWLKDTNEIQAKKIVCRPFTSQLFKTWHLDEEYCYRTHGRIVTIENKVMLLFDFNKTESWKYRSKSKEYQNG